MQGTETMNIVNTVWPFLLMGLIFYFMLYRPQKKEQKKRTEMLNALKRGNKVVTLGGICGEITKVNENNVMLKIAEGLEVKVIKGAVSHVQEEIENK
ncbi:MAG: preprotein translocase subunit YajC [Acidaminococcaceae bacterium]|nr:preprotein translocase subunit YajC [Acidaminococcaceae bacterium]MDD4721237.1 preprotein translocase subunit YajC [Acidaminococcaceae bacterium]